MEETPPFLTAPEDTRGEIMGATYRALCRHGYSGITVQRIAEEFEKSKSLLYHHYDDKDELLLAFLDYMLEEFEETVAACDADGPAEQFDAMLDQLLVGSGPPAAEQFIAAMVELRAQAAHDERYREQFSHHDGALHDRLVAVTEAGIEAGCFRDVDADRVATFLLTLVVGAMTRRATLENSAGATVREEVESYVDRRLRVEGGDE